MIQRYVAQFGGTGPSTVEDDDEDDDDDDDDWELHPHLCRGSAVTSATGRRDCLQREMHSFEFHRTVSSPTMEFISTRQHDMSGSSLAHYIKPAVFLNPI